MPLPYLACFPLSGDIVLITKPMAISEGERVVLTTGILMATDSGSESAELVYTVTIPPKHGHLHLVQYPGIPLLSFTQMDVASHQVCYTHDNSHFTDHDSFRSVSMSWNISKMFLIQYIYISTTKKYLTQLYRILRC